MAQFEGNSLKSRRSVDGQKHDKLQPVVTERPIVTKKKLRILDCLYSSDKPFGEYIIEDLVIPNAKRMAATVLHDIVSKVFGGGFANDRLGYRFTNSWWGDKWNDGSYVEYSSKSINKPAGSSQQKPIAQQASTDLESYSMRSREDAESVLEGLEAYIETYDAVPVSAFFELIGITAPYTYNDYGWTNLADTKVISTPNGYSIRFPKPIRIRS